MILWPAAGGSTAGGLSVALRSASALALASCASAFLASTARRSPFLPSNHATVAPVMS